MMEDIKAKVCITCSVSKPLSSYNRKEFTKDGLHSICTKCKVNKTREKRKENTHKAIVHLGGKCKDCGLVYTGNNAIVFDFHHVNPSDKSFSLSQRSNTSFKNFMTEISKCVLLCANCHRLHHEQERLSNS